MLIIYEISEICAIFELKYIVIVYRVHEWNEKNLSV